ncbi:hypothetical protein C7972_10370 [Arenibacter sp. ARW7G5Y1]|nr:hypothetical protein C7972_10370 [Arenibacter sp. ARW7G5Y1]
MLGPGIGITDLKLSGSRYGKYKKKKGYVNLSFEWDGLHYRYEIAKEIIPKKGLLPRMWYFILANKVHNSNNVDYVLI